jgi:hypothetical protein
MHSLRIRRHPIVRRKLVWLLIICGGFVFNSTQAKLATRHDQLDAPYTVDVVVMPESDSILAGRNVEVTITASRRVEIDAIILNPDSTLSSLRAEWRSQKKSISQVSHPTKAAEEVVHEPILQAGEYFMAPFSLPTGWNMQQLLNWHLLGFNAKDYPITIVVEGSEPATNGGKDRAFSDSFSSTLSCQAVLPLVLLGGFAGGILFSFWPLWMRIKRGQAIKSWSAEVRTAGWNGFGGAFITCLLVLLGPYISNLDFGFKISVTSAGAGLAVGVLSYAMTKAVDKFLMGTKR